MKALAAAWVQLSWYTLPRPLSKGKGTFFKKWRTATQLKAEKDLPREEEHLCPLLCVGLAGNRPTPASVRHRNGGADEEGLLPREP